MRRHGGNTPAWMRPPRPARSGSKRTRSPRDQGLSKHGRRTSRNRGRSCSQQYRCRSFARRPRYRSRKEPNSSGSASMTSFRQAQANRRNASKSTGPTTEEGKRRSRGTALRHGLTAETVIGALEDAEDTKNSKPSSAPITGMPNQRSSGNWCCGWRVYCGGCAALRPSKPVCLKFRPTWAT